MRAAIFYATREGQARRVAERIAAGLQARHADVDVHNVKALNTPIDWSVYAGAFVVASVHAGRHEPEMIAFVKRFRPELERLSAAFLSLTLSEAGAEDTRAPAERREHARADAERMIDVFVADTGWRPANTLCVAGALAYSRYNFFVKFIMRRIARKAGFDGDTSRDYEFTDWAAVDRFVRHISLAGDISSTADYSPLATGNSALPPP